MVFGNPARGPRIVPFGGTRKATDRIPNGRPAFRVTQRFADLDAYFQDRPHGAMDIGNGYCGDEIIAMIGGRVDLLRDPNGALCVRVANGKLVTEQWHLLRVLVADGAWVVEGQAVGLNGATGLDIGGCHCHVKTSIDGGRTWVDPWPLLDQNRPKPGGPTMPAPPFSDLAGNPHRGTIERAAKLGIAAVGGTGKFSPKTNITRDEAVVMVMRGYDAAVAQSKK